MFTGCSIISFTCCPMSLGILCNLIILLVIRQYFILKLGGVGFFFLFSENLCVPTYSMAGRTESGCERIG